MMIMMVKMLGGKMICEIMIRKNSGTESRMSTERIRNGVDPAAGHPGGGADEHPETDGDGAGDEPDRERDAGAEERAGKAVAAELVGAEGMRPARRLQHPARAAGLIAFGSYGAMTGAKSAASTEDDQEPEPEAGQPVAAEEIPGAQEERPLRRAEAPVLPDAAGQRGGGHASVLASSPRPAD